MATVCAITLALGAAGCEGSDGDRTATKRTASSATRGEIGYLRAVRLEVEDNLDGFEEGASNAALIEERLREVQVGLAAGKGQDVCLALTATGQRELAHLRGAGFQRCKDVITEVARRRYRDGVKTKLSEIVAVTIRGDRATATVRNAGTKPFDVTFHREDGSWRLTSLILLDADAIDNPPQGHRPRFVEPRRGTVRELLHDVQADFPRYRVGSVCDNLTDAGRRELALSGNARDCERAVQDLLRRELANGFQPRSSRVLHVRRSGDRARMLVKDPGARPYVVPVVRQEGRWKLPSLALAEPVEVERSER